MTVSVMFIATTNKKTNKPTWICFPVPCSDWRSAWRAWSKLREAEAEEAVGQVVREVVGEVVGVVLFRVSHSSAAITTCDASSIYLIYFSAAA